MSILVWFYIAGFLGSSINMIRLLRRFYWMLAHDDLAWAGVALFLTHTTTWLLLGLLAFSASVVIWGDLDLYHAARGPLRGAGYTAVALCILETLYISWYLGPPAPWLAIPWVTRK